jgi:DNA-binding transcriptional regulator YdaS (Cro superfamily)
MLAVQRATDIADGITPLALFLGVPPGLVGAWIEGRQDVPPAAFLAIVSIIIDRAIPHAEGVIPVSLAETFRHREAANR